jgi:hypothetical protein
MTRESRHGIGGAVADVVEGRQLELLGRIAAPPARAPKRGRPPGARNRKTVEMLEYLERRYTSPLEGLAKTWSMDTLALAKELDCSVEEAFDKQQAARVAALRFWHQALSPDVTIAAGGIDTINFITGPHLGVGGGADEDLGALLEAGMEMLQNQGVNDDDDDPV